MNRRTFLSLVGSSSLAATVGCRPDSGVEALDVASASTSATELARFDALGQAELFKTGEVSALELVNAAIERIERFDGPLNCVVHRAFDHARAAAATATPDDGPFAGVPYLLKALEAREGMPHTLGSRFFAEQIATASDPVTLAAENAGLIYLGNSSAPEFGLIASTAPTLYGACNNPWDLERSPAGSSGGSGSLVAAGVVPIATADDGGGSIRLPASTCGTVGLKCSRGREVGHAEQFLVNTGCESRSMRDTAAFVNATENKSHPELAPIGLVGGPPPQRLRIAFTALGNDLRYEPADDVADSIIRTAATLEELGHQVTESRFEVNGEEMGNHFMVLWTSGAAQIVDLAREQLGREPDDRDFEAWTFGLASESKTHSAEALQQALTYFEGLRSRYHSWLGDFDVALTPVTRTTAQLTSVQDPRRADYQALREDVFAWVNYTPLHNAVGAPSLSLPLHQSPNGLPIGSLFSGAWGSEPVLLQLGFELEQALPWASRWPIHSVFA